jgi:hypothetical protein
MKRFDFRAVSISTEENVDVRNKILQTNRTPTVLYWVLWFRSLCFNLSII